MEGFFQQVYRIIVQIPYGRVCTYGQIARLLGNPRQARVVGYALRAAPDELPCHRVVNRFGELSDAFSPQGKETHRQKLAAEGVGFLPDGRVDLAAHFWAGPEAPPLDDSQAAAELLRSEGW